MSVTIYQSGRRGNCFYATSFLLAYAKKHDLEYFIPHNADAYKHFTGNNKNPFAYIPSTGARPINPRHLQESNIHTNPSYQPNIPKIDGILFDGYWQSHLYFDWCRDFILQQFNLPNNVNKDITAIHVRMGDCLGSINFPICPLEYYINSVKYMQDKGFNKFKIFSDNIRWCKVHFNNTNFPEALFEFSENTTEEQDYIQIVNSGNVITARSTFSLSAAWLNQNPNKIVLVPTTRLYWWRGQNLDMLKGTGFIEIEFEKHEDLILERQY